MASSLQPVTEAIVTKLLATAAVTSLLTAGGNTNGVYDHVPSATTGLYVEVGDGFEMSDDTFGKTGKQANVYITSWDNTRTYSRIGGLETAIADALDNQALTVADNVFIHCKHDRSGRQKEIDETRRCEMEFTIWTTES